MDPEEKVGKWFVVRIFLFPALASELLNDSLGISFQVTAERGAKRRFPELSSAAPRKRADSFTRPLP